MQADDPHTAEIILDLSRIINRLDEQEHRINSLSRSVDGLRDLVRLTRRERADRLIGEAHE